MSEEYDRQTGRFIAAIATHMPKGISGDVMQGWIENPEALQKVLSVLCPPAETMQKAAEDRVMREGDPAYTKYHGFEYVGVLTKVNRTRGTATLIPGPDNNWGFLRKLSVGYDEAAKWEEDSGRWYAPADHD